MKKWLRLLPVLVLSVIMVCGLSVTASAEKVLDTGSCGENLTYTRVELDDRTVVLTITGTGDMYDWPNDQKEYSPWYYGPGEPKVINIGEGVTSIGQNALPRSGELEEVNLPSTLKRIGDGAFSGCKKLSSIRFPEGITYLGKSAFSGCNSLKEVNLSKLSATALQRSAFNRCDNLRHVTLPEEATTVPEYCFYFCRALEDIPLDHIERIEEGAFSETAVTNLVTPDSVQYIGAEAFSACSKLENVKTSAEFVGADAFEACIELKTATLEEGVKTLESGVFNSCVALEKMYLPKSLRVGHLLDEDEDGNCDYALWRNSNLSAVPDTETPPKIYVYHGTDAEKLARATEEIPSENIIYRDNTQSREDEKQCKVTFDPNYKGGKKKVRTLTQGQPYGDLIPAKRERYRFNGWYTTKTAGSKITATTKVPAKDKVTVYAHWDTSRSVTYVLNGGENHPSNPAVYSAKQSVTLKNPTRTGYLFQGWYEDSKFKRKNNKIPKNSAGDMTFYAKWKPISYKISFNSNGGSGSTKAMTLKYDQKANLTANGFQKKGYQFSFWTTKKNGAGTSYRNKQSVKNLTSSNGKTITLYAQWKPVSYRITYQNVGLATEDAAAVQNPNTTRYTAQSGTITLKNPSCTGYDFKGWYTDSACSKKASTTIKSGTSGNKTFYAKWSAHTYTVAFHANGGTGTMSSMKKRSYAKSFTLKANTFVRNEYVFKGWNTSPDGSGAGYTDGQSVRALTAVQGGTVTLYAQWEEDCQKAMWFMHDMNITQLPNEGGHKGTQNFDVIGSTSNDIFAPFDCKVVAVYPEERSGNTVIVQSIKPVRYADGRVDYMCMAFAHDNDISNVYNSSTGAIYQGVIKQGEVFYQTGTYGPNTGRHSHVTCIAGTYQNDFWTVNEYGNSCSPNAIPPTSALFISSSTNIVNSAGLNFAIAN